MTVGLKKSLPYVNNVNPGTPGSITPHPAPPSTSHFYRQVTEWSGHSRHEEDASSIGHTASSGWGGTLVIAKHTTQQAQEKEGHNEGQQEADNQATQPPAEKSTVLSNDVWL